jgi:hypothetical protein
MSTSAPTKFLVLYLAPSDVLADWAKTDPAVRKTEEQKMRAAWQRWMSDNAKIIRTTEAAGKTKAVTSFGIGDVKNDIMLYSIVEAANHDDAAEAFANHPHLLIPRSSIQITEVRVMGPM